MDPAAPTDAQDVWREEVRGGYPDPRLLALSGLERMETFRRRQAPAPPLHHLTGSTPVRFGSGTADATMPATGWLLNSAGVIGGGTLAIVADIAFGLAVQTEIPAATSYTTAELSLTFLRPIHAGPTIRASGQAIHVGRRVGLSEVFILADGPERLLAHGTSRLSISAPRDDIPPLPEEIPLLEPPSFPTPDPYLREPPAGVIPQATWDELDGLEVLRRQIAGELPPPPIHRLTGMRGVEATEGSATMVLPLTAWLTSPAGTVQGGVTAMLADASMMAAALTTAPRGTTIAGLDLKVNYLRPVFADGSELVSRAQIVHSGRTIAIVRAEISNADGKPAAVATGSAMYLADRPASLGEVELDAG
jgi:uncharacterized protein (TIGR00369 family)